MDCKEAEKLIQPYVQGNMPEKEMEPFISHIRKCHTCHEELETYFIVNRAMAYFEDDAPDLPAEGRECRGAHVLSPQGG